MMRPLDLDYRRASRRPRLVAWVLAAAALAVTADAALRYQGLRDDVQVKQLRLANTAMLRLPRAAVLAHPVNAEEYAFARDTIRRIATPWQPFFAALEDAQTDRVALLSIEPDVDSGTVSLNGEAKDYLAALTYLAQLTRQKELARVHFLRHEVRRTGSPRPLAFTISAAWKEEQ